MNPIVRQYANQRVSLIAQVGQFRLEQGLKGPIRLVRLVNVCLAEDTSEPLMDEYWCAVTAGMKALHLMEGDRISFSARVTLHRDAPGPRRFGQSSLLWNRVVTLDRPTQLKKITSA